VHASRSIRTCRCPHGISEEIRVPVGLVQTGELPCPLDGTKTTSDERNNVNSARAVRCVIFTLHLGVSPRFHTSLNLLKSIAQEASQPQLHRHKYTHTRHLTALPIRRYNASRLLNSPFTLFHRVQDPECRTSPHAKWLLAHCVTTPQSHATCRTNSPDAPPLTHRSRPPPHLI
jgi:hypothetical protein